MTSQPAPVALLHGLFMTASFWTPETILPLSRLHETGTLSLPGHAPEPPFDGPLTGEGLLECFDRQLDAVFGPDRPVHLVGHSTGGLMALYYAACRPERILSVVSVGGSENGEEEALSYRFMQFAGNHWGLLGQLLLAPSLWLSSFNYRVHRAFLKEAVADPERVLESEVVTHAILDYLPDLQKLDRASLAHLLAELQHFDASEALKTMQVPALIICGDQDCFVSLDRTYRLADLIPTSELHVFENCGHMVMWEHPQRFYDLLCDFFQRHSAPSENQARKPRVAPAC